MNVHLAPSATFANRNPNAAYAPLALRNSARKPLPLFAVAVFGFSLGLLAFGAFEMAQAAQHIAAPLNAALTGAR